MNVLVVNASPHKNSKTERFCKLFEKYLSVPYKQINLCDYNIPFSDGTYKKIDGDMEELRKLVLECDGLFIASPTYWYNVPSILKAFIEQLTCIDSKLWQRERMLAIAVHAPHGGELGVFNAIVAPLNMFGFSLVGNGYAWYAGGRYKTSWWGNEVKHIANRFSK